MVDSGPRAAITAIGDKQVDRFGASIAALCGPRMIGGSGMLAQEPLSPRAEQSANRGSSMSDLSTVAGRRNGSSSTRRALAGATIAALSLLAVIAIAPASASACVSFEVKGQWLCNNQGSVTPLVGARVELWKPGGSDPWIDEKLGATHTSGQRLLQLQSARRQTTSTSTPRSCSTMTRASTSASGTRSRDWDTETADHEQPCGRREPRHL